MRKRELKDQVAIITGSSSGIGKSVAWRLHELGCNVVLNGWETKSTGEELAREWGHTTYVDADISTRIGANLIVEHALKTFGGIDLLVNNAGIARQIPHDNLDAVEDAFWDRIMAVNLKGAWNMVKAARTHLAQRHGQIINTASLAGLTESGSSIPYAVSKAGIVHLTKLLAKALGPDVRVNAVAPGYIDTPLTHDWVPLREFIISHAPMRRLGVPDDVADVVEGLIFMSYVTGAVIPVAGGLELI